MLLCSCTGYAVLTESGDKVELSPPPTLPPVPTPLPTIKQEYIPPCQSDGIRDISCWAVYWDTADVLAEIAPYASRLGTLCYFEAFFDENGGFVLPDTVSEFYSSVEKTYPENRWDSYLTFVNDMQKSDGSIELKSAELAARFLTDADAMDKHIESLIGFTVEKGFDGIEIDYEALRRMPELWEPFTVFCSRLYARTQQEQLGLRIVLEPNAPVDEYLFPTGPAYVIMCYNLHGAHNDPGAKADFSFLSELIEKSSYLPGRKIFALSTGGYDWDDNGEAVQVTLRKAFELYDKYGDDAPVRYEDSAALSFEYTDEENRKHTIWCADTQTLGEWKGYIRNAGFGELAYWRLGGNYLR